MPSGCLIGNAHAGTPKPLHEMAHLAGAVNLIDAIGYDAVRDIATHAPSESYANADSYRYYIFNTHNQ